MDEAIQELLAARRAHNVARASVEKWMREQGEQGHLQQNCNAPGWADYEKELRRWHLAVAVLDGVL